MKYWRIYWSKACQWTIQSHGAKHVQLSTGSWSTNSSIKNKVLESVAIKCRWEEIQQTSAAYPIISNYYNSFFQELRHKSIWIVLCWHCFRYTRDSCSSQAKEILLILESVCQDNNRNGLIANIRNMDWSESFMYYLLEHQMYVITFTEINVPISSLYVKWWKHVGHIV